MQDEQEYTSSRSTLTRLYNLASSLAPQQRRQYQQRRYSSASVHPSFRSKAVCQLNCKFCNIAICHRGMKAILLADTRVELFSTDHVVDGRVQLVGSDYMTRNCNCRIRDVACLGCGNVVGYHVTHACDSCMGACNNGHFWMFHSDTCQAQERRNEKGSRYDSRWCARVGQSTSTR
ncbi:FAM72 protein-domain-containing protein [Gorgonomyces haynaldii]|nr:FAM72 protein-domain-containing protein [Gorgonomyces haynaldii]